MARIPKLIPIKISLAVSRPRFFIFIVVIIFATKKISPYAISNMYQYLNL